MNVLKFSVFLIYCLRTLEILILQYHFQNLKLLEIMKKLTINFSLVQIDFKNNES